VAVLTFHSGEDRRVKKAFAAGWQREITWRCAGGAAAGPEERRENPRSSSAKLRWAVKGASLAFTGGRFAVFISAMFARLRFATVPAAGGLADELCRELTSSSTPPSPPTGPALVIAGRLGQTRTLTYRVASC